MSAFTSLGEKIDHKYNNGGGPPNLRIQGRHRISHLLPQIGQQPKFAQLYIYDIENEIHNRIQSLGYNTLVLIVDIILCCIIILI